MASKHLRETVGFCYIYQIFSGVNFAENPFTHMQHFTKLRILKGGSLKKKQKTMFLGFLYHSVSIFMKISLKIFELKIILLFGRVLDSKLAAVAPNDT